MTELSSNRTGANGFQVKTQNENSNVMRSLSPQMFEFTTKKCTKIYNPCTAVPLLLTLNPILVTFSLPSPL